MSQLTLSHIQSYPIGELKMIFEGKGGRIITLEGITNGGKLGTIIKAEKGGSMILENCGFLPILFPISDLTTPITINGEEKIPIVELAKSVCPFKSYGFEFDIEAKDGINYEIWVNLYNESGGVVIWSMTYNFHFNIFIPSSEGDDCERYFDQLQAFDWLHKHLFDTRNLIGQGLAVSVHDIDPTIYNS